MGSIERFFGILIEHYAGAFPTVAGARCRPWSCTITDKQQEYADPASSRAQGRTASGLKRDFRNEKIGFKIREAEKAKIPYMLVVGDQEMEAAPYPSAAAAAPISVDAGRRAARSDAHARSKYDPTR